MSSCQFTLISFFPYRKPDNPTLYTSNCSYHPPKVIKQIPKSISKRLSALSSNNEKAKPGYCYALDKIGFNELSYIPTQNNNDSNNNRKRKHKLIWYNPPYSATIKTNNGKTFLNLINKALPKNKQTR